MSKKRIASIQSVKGAKERGIVSGKSVKLIYEKGTEVWLKQFSSNRAAKKWLEARGIPYREIE